MDVFDLVGCKECESYKFYPGKFDGYPDHCYPDEAVCRQGVPDNGLCEQIKDSLHNMILDGKLETQNGYFIDKDWAFQIIQGDTDCDEETVEKFKSVGWEAAPYWWVPDDFNPLVEKLPIPYLSVEEVYGRVFG